MCLDQNPADAHALPSKIGYDLQRLCNNWNSVTWTSAARKRSALRAQKRAVLRKMNLVLAAPGCGSEQVDDQPHARLVGAAGAAVHEEAAPGKARHFGRLESELKLMVYFFKQTAEAFSLVTVLLVGPHSPPQACDQIIDRKPPQRVGPYV